MVRKIQIFAAVILYWLVSATGMVHAQEKKSPPVEGGGPKAVAKELAFVKDSVGVWDAKIEVWPNGLDADSIKFSGVETNRAYGKHWLASDFDSTVMGQTVKVHSIIGYDVDKKKFMGTVIDHGVYSAKMVGEFDGKTRSIDWITKVKGGDGKLIIQKTKLTQKSATERHLVLMTQDKDDKKKFGKFMEIKFTKRAVKK